MAKLFASHREPVPGCQLYSYSIYFRVGRMIFSGGQDAHSTSIQKKIQQRRDFSDRVC
ncbi:hypothetical protein [Moorena sp. SIO3H5]|uniref:hypothetical protein n=1 Tax=Moorena sp. SIO3H5 TaxID=2607834 RepID=UPI0013BBB845|nr:hypothetical protein [Moorena sp. SIO3H5]NEO69970.1 hypothetical protein [Moorena sp. SIO3H5]